eukprot:30087-Pelagococcus_subviridis.AAC.30
MLFALTADAGSLRSRRSKGSRASSFASSGRTFDNAPSCSDNAARRRQFPITFFPSAFPTS